MAGIVHERFQDGVIKPGIDLAAKDSSRNIEATPNLALRRTMHVLSKVMREDSAFILGVVGDRRYYAEMDEKSGGE